MKNNYTSLKSPLDEEDELKTDHEIDLEKGPLPEYDSEEESTLPPYSDHALVNNPPNTHRENHSYGTTDNSSPLLIILLISFTSIILFNAPEVCYLKYKDAFFKNYGAAEWTLFGFWCLVCTLALIFLTYFYETWTKAVKVTVISLAKCVKVTAIFLAQCVKACGKGIKHFLKKWENMPMAFSEVFLFNILVGSPRMNLRYIFGDRWGLKCSLADHIIFVVLSILVFIAETVKPGSIRVNLIRKMGYEAKQQVNEYTAVPLREMNSESEA
ncbi:wtf antidote-like meiotic drive suppressor Wtf5 [Schizosaccharomyces pombe]|uniref:Meiotic drive suppressor wtf5 n=1 Tax=Schizosaccharomyces pombe (strain 972 / ATCC 24843) TaxID=284812 RepID=WTF5_SCHPO|nr:wtf element Wtf5 [Schizosaccharomyces pombe]Q8TF80.1 RecName: Full=Meiotic drive suppressor wtf5 [Schizosaccharomyces pombe 972h-]CAA19130.1 wtf element Wtf5 [Schizosaccharomyces pombe]|eukprot:NP_587750.1 wtf element Wtf5 [Schizosaccharomyces pombe]